MYSQDSPQFPRQIRLHPSRLRLNSPMGKILSYRLLVVRLPLSNSSGKLQGFGVCKFGTPWRTNFHDTAALQGTIAVRISVKDSGDRESNGSNNSDSDRR